MITNVMTKYINALCAQHFRGKEIQDKDILIDKAGWYWADSEDNIRYTDFTGPFNSKEKAIDHGRMTRVIDLQRMIRLGVMTVKVDKFECLKRLFDLEKQLRAKVYY